MAPPGAHPRAPPCMIDIIRLTYRELAQRLGIEPDSAAMKASRLAKSGRWKLIPGNHPGSASTVEVPATDLVREGAPGRSPLGAPVQQTGGSAPGARGPMCRRWKIISSR